MSAGRPARPGIRRASRRVLGALAAAVLLAASSAAMAAPAGSPVVLPGWPQRVGAGTVLPGPGGGVVVVSFGEPLPSPDLPFTTRAFRRDGHRLWVDRRVPQCGNCEAGAQPLALQPDGSYGPIGWEASDFWALDARGRELPGCRGAVAADGTCYLILGDSDPVLSSPRPGVYVRSRAGADLWRVVDRGYLWIPEGPPVVVIDDAGLVYAGLGPGLDVPSGVARAGRLIAIDPVSRTIAWTRPDVVQVLTSLGSGVLATRPGGVVSIGPDGSERWSRPLAAGETVTPSTTVYDATRDRLYLGRSSGVTALVAGTGAQVWRTRRADHAQLLSVGRSGRVYVSVATAARRGVRGLRPRDGRAAWTLRTGLPVLGALELADGAVAVSAGDPAAPTRAGRLTLLRP